jgi:hypothetical protein
VSQCNVWFSSFKQKRAIVTTIFARLALAELSRITVLGARIRTLT